MLSLEKNRNFKVQTKKHVLNSEGTGKKVGYKKWETQPRRYELFLLWLQDDKLP